MEPVFSLSILGCCTNMAGHKNTMTLIFRWFFTNENILINVILHFCHILLTNPPRSHTLALVISHFKNTVESNVCSSHELSPCVVNCKDNQWPVAAAECEHKCILITTSQAWAASTVWAVRKMIVPTWKTFVSDSDKKKHIFFNSFWGQDGTDWYWSLGF